MSTAADRPKTWGDLNEEEKQAWAAEFIELAEAQIKGYNGAKDAECSNPWCAPWYTEGETESSRTPAAYLDEVRAELSKLAQETP